MIWRRYRSTLLLAVMISAAMGTACGLAIYMTGNADYRAQSGWVGFAYWVGLGGGSGIATGLAAMLGGVALLKDPVSSEASGSRIKRVTIGASIGGGLLWLIIAVVVAVTGGADYAYIFVIVAVVVAAVAALLARAILSASSVREHDGLLG